MICYADASFLVSLYLPDTNSAQADLWTAANSQAILASPLAVLEVTNAMGLRAFRKQSDAAACGLARDRFYADLASRVWQRAPFPRNAWTRARRISLTHTERLGVRSLDILHVAVALELEAETFLTFDRRQALLARAEGLKTPIQAT